MEATSYSRCLEGRIEHRLKLTPQCSDQGRKRKRESQDKTHNSVGSNAASNDPNLDDQDDDWKRTNGFYFIQNADGASSPEISVDKDCFLLSVPQQLAKTVCDAARYQCQVRIVRYHLTLLETIPNQTTPSPRSKPTTTLYCSALDDIGLPSWSPEIDASRNQSGSSLASSKLFLIEVDMGGLQLINPPAIPNDSLPNDIVWTLTQLHRKERLDRIMPVSSENGTSRRPKERYNLTATIDAISPIIAMIPSDPFCLVELYDSVDTTGDTAGMIETCVVVLKGPSALVYHMGIQPGDRITLIRAKRQKWQVPEQLKSKYGHRLLQGRVPQYAFVLDDSPEARILWDDPWRKAPSERMNLSPTLPATILPLVSLDAQVITRVQTTTSSTNHVSIHLIELSSLNLHDHSIDGVAQRTTLFLTFYPLSTAQQLSLRVGAVIRAMNVHPLASYLWKDKSASTAVEYCYYATCLRSTVALLQTATDSQRFGPTHIFSKDIPNVPCDPSNYQSVVSKESSPIVISLGQIVPFRFCRFHLTMEEYMIQHYILACNDESNVLNDLLPLASAQRQRSPSVNDVAMAAASMLCTKPCSSSSRFGPGETAKDDNAGSTRNEKAKKPRDPYFEFFGHTVDGEVDGDLQDMGTSDNSLSPDLCQSASLPLLSWPHCLAPDKIREVGLKILTDKLGLINGDQQSRLDSMHSVQAGWTASLHLNAAEVIEEEETKTQSMVALCTAGICTFDEGINPHPGHVYISSSNVKLPLNLDSQTTSPHWAGELVVVRIHAVVVSCLCIGACNLSNTKEAAVFRSIEHLPSFGNRWGENLRGACSVVRVGKWFYIASVQLRCDAITLSAQKLGGKGPENPQRAITEPSLNRCKAILDCLANDGVEHFSDSGITRFEGILIRQRYKFSKAGNDVFNGCVLTLSHVDSGDDKTDNTAGEEGGTGSRVCSFQAVEMKLLIPLRQKQATTLQKAFGLIKVDRQRLTDDQVNLTLAWWSVADVVASCALVSGGWDDVQRKRDTKTAVVVYGPVTAFHNGSKGYKRLSCKLSELRVSFARLEAENNFKEELCSKTFSFVGGYKFLPGMMDQRPSRALLDDSATGVSSAKMHFGALLSSPCSGFSCSSLAGLHWNLCRDLRQQTQTSLAPSVVRCIRRASFLGVAFCRAQIECTKCFQPLTGLSASHRNGANKRKGDDTGIGVVSSISAGSTYFETDTCRSKTVLRCGNGCYIDFAEVKWECSGILDDGTGQAKLYAERDAALTLLGMHGKFIKAIEDGAWSTPQGFIIFQKSVPPKSSVKRAVLEAQAVAHGMLRQENYSRKSIENKGKQRSLSEDDILKLLTPIARAEYLLQRHCRFMTTGYQFYDYFVRCKPIFVGTAKVPHLNRTQIDVSVPAAEGRGVPVTQSETTYSLPPLKLTMVDCSLSLSRPTPIHMHDSWGTVQELRESTAISKDVARTHVAYP